MSNRQRPWAWRHGRRWILAGGYVLAAVVLSGYHDPPTPAQLKSEPTEFFIVPEQRYAHMQEFLEHLEAGVIAADRFSAEPYEITLRPIDTKVAVPRHYIEQIRRPYRVFAGEIWDLVFIEALLPDMSPRTEQNETLFFESGSNRRVRIRLGSLSSDNAYRRVVHSIARRELVEVARRLDIGVTEYRVPPHQESPAPPAYFVADHSRIKSPAGNLIVIACVDGWWNGNEESITCQVQMSLPRSLWPTSFQHRFGETPGVNLTYFFSKSHLDYWQTIHWQVLCLLNRFLVDVTAIPYREQKAIGSDCTIAAHAIPE